MVALLRAVVVKPFKSSRADNLMDFEVSRSLIATLPRSTRPLKPVAILPFSVVMFAAVSSWPSVKPESANTPSTPRPIVLAATLP